MARETKKKAADREKMKEQLLKRTQESYARKDGEVKGKYFDPDSELPLWSPAITKDDPHIIDIIPFVAGDNYPLVDRRQLVKKGDIAYVLDLYVHVNVGPAKEMIVCPAKNYGQPCPICDHITTLIKDGADYEDYQDFVAKRRCAYNVLVVTDEKEQEKGVRVWEASYRYSEKQILALAKAPRTGGYIPFSHPDRDVGKSICFDVIDDKYRTISGMKFIDRDYDIPDEVLGTAYTLDDHIVLLPYEEIAKKFHMSHDAATDDGQQPTDDERGGKEEQGSQPADEAQDTCPFGHTLGEDLNKHAECNECSDAQFEVCNTEADRLEEERAKAKEKQSTRTLRKRK